MAEACSTLHPSSARNNCRRRCRCRRWSRHNRRHSRRQRWHHRARAVNSHCLIIHYQFAAATRHVATAMAAVAATIVGPLNGWVRERTEIILNCCPLPFSWIKIAYFLIHWTSFFFLYWCEHANDDDRKENETKKRRRRREKTIPLRSNWIWWEWKIKWFYNEVYSLSSSASYCVLCRP